MVQDSSIDYIFKILLLGEPSVGKTSLMIRYIANTFNISYTSTIGVEFMKKVVNSKWGKVSIIIWDVAGQSKHTSYRDMYYKGSSYVIFIFDITNRKTFLNLKKWIASTMSIFNYSVKFIIIGNKLDLDSQRAVWKKDYDELFHQYKDNMFFYMETSAKTGKNVEEAFNIIIEELVKKA